MSPWRTRGWLSSVAGVPEEKLASNLGELAGRRRDDGLVFARWALVMYRFEKELHKDPDRENLNALWWESVERIQLIQRPPGREGEPDWAAKLHVALAPVYYP